MYKRQALHRTLLERIKKGENSILSERINMENPLTLDEIIAAVNKEDVLCIEIVEEIGQKLGKQIAGLINIFNPCLLYTSRYVSPFGGKISSDIFPPNGDTYRPSRKMAYSTLYQANI